MGGEPRLVDHLRGHEIEGAGTTPGPLAVALEDRGPADDRVGLVGAMPVLAHVDRGRRAYHQLRRRGRRVEMADHDLWGGRAELGNDPRPGEVPMSEEGGLLGSLSRRRRTRMHPRSHTATARGGREDDGDRPMLHHGYALLCSTPVATAGRGRRPATARS